MKPIPEDEIEAATEIGLNRRAPRFGEGHPARLQPCTRAVRHGRRTESADRCWSINAKQQWCDYFPEAINAYGFEYYNTTVTPYCKSDDGVYHFTIESKNPCDENKYYVGFMDVVTNSSNCLQTWVETEGFNSTVTAKPFDEATFQPLECTGIYRPAFEEEIEGLATQLLWETVVDPTFQGVTAGQFDDAWYCDDSPGYKYINITDVSACFSKTRDYPPKVQAQGKVQWVCTQQARRRTIELRVDTPYVTQCEWEVSIQMGDSPEVPQPGAEDA
ncbi:hypothetical protein COHA_002008 [Chlorella ohadii]|uniref:Uncharacterized protein n=1 Tax=Chlorella ohadii TaxID=2649997 RepID=A0AAD5H4Z0_9CHLO|nr:hypothetical protein COHA_002008 [Chlorella ohadii]